MRPETDIFDLAGVKVPRPKMLSPVLAALPLLLLAGPVRAQPAPSGMPGGGMPNLRAMSGKPLPDSGMALGTVTVRVARKIPANAVANVEITAVVRGPGGDARKHTAKTDAGGRAFFAGLPVGHEFRAEVVVDGETLATDTFAVPESGGVRTMLIAGLGASGGDKGDPGRNPGEGAPGEAGEDDKQPFRLGFISGSVKPDPSLAAGTIETLALDESGRPIPRQIIELGYIRPGGRVQVARQPTDANGVARFLDVGAGGASGEIGAAAVMQYEKLRLGSDGFNLPTVGGVKIELRVPTRTADPSVITIGAGGRVILQVRDDNVSFIETLPLENHSDKLFDPGPGGVEIPLPREFVSADAAEGEHKIEIRKGLGIAVHGLIPPRRPQTADPNFKSPDEVTFGFVLPATGSTRDFEQKFPTGLGEFTFITDQIAGLTIDSTQITGRQEREMGGKKYWLMRGEAIPPGGFLRFTARGLPAPDNTGRVVAGSLALALIAAAFLFGRQGGRSARAEASTERDRLVQRREKLFSDLVGIEARDVAERSGRGELVQKLESVYREIAAWEERHAV
jgi:hypothetical protein